MTRIYTTTFAATGDKETLAATDPGTGKVSLPSGWTPDYEKLDTDPSYRPVGRKEMNGVINEVTAAVGELQQYGFAPWQALTGGWPLNARVVSGGIVYKSTAAANTAVPPAAPWVMDAAADINSAPAKPVLADADELGVTDSANSFGLVKVTWANLKGQLAGTHNKIINGNFGVNQRAVSGTVVLTAGQYGHDYWKAGASGCTYTFVTVNNVTTITITAGSLTQIINGKNLFSGTHVLSWAGTAQGRVQDAGAYGASGLTASVTGGANTTVEFTAGTLWLAQFEPGSTPTTFEFRLNELQLCQQRYFKTYDVGTAPASGINLPGFISRFLEGACNFPSLSVSFPMTMEGTPSVTIYSPSLNTVGNFSRNGVDVPASVQSIGSSYASARVTGNTCVADQHLTAHFVAVAGL